MPPISVAHAGERGARARPSEEKFFNLNLTFVHRLYSNFLLNRIEIMSLTNHSRAFGHVTTHLL